MSVTSEDPNITGDEGETAPAQAGADPPGTTAEASSPGNPSQKSPRMEWLERVKILLGPRGYDHSMRRSIQTLVIYEAKRCIQQHLVDMRPFQRKLALVDQAQALVGTLDFCLPHHRAEILWRTATSRETVTPEICWKRCQLVQKELDRLAHQMKQFVAPDRTHQEACDLLEQHLFEHSGDNQGKPNSGKLVPPNWGHAHNHVLLCFRLYYKGYDLDPEFPEAVPPKPIVVPTAKETAKELGASGSVSSRRESVEANSDGEDESLPTATPTRSYRTRSRASTAAAAAESVTNENDVNGNKNKTNNIKMSSPVSTTPAASVIPPVNPIEERRKLLKEVREHLDLLRDFEDVAPKEDLSKRKRELYAALPPAPPPFKASKKMRYV